MTLSACNVAPSAIPCKHQTLSASVEGIREVVDGKQQCDDDAADVLLPL